MSDLAGPGVAASVLGECTDVTGARCRTVTRVFTCRRRGVVGDGRHPDQSQRDGCEDGQHSVDGAGCAVQLK
ncbi:hypothetical protein [Streptomyces akebiae]|uniref:Uncharacterized protein n=1 Tax=Streptomyces akebiae TaxID=2865673 RepID=A0ABX8XUG3_9ACTN|nr:hypothetical protein [Streptomyces akebiae]QYX79415.1 hypothetical protein K1J60_25460 [Streptomyces akebiae]